MCCMALLLILYVSGAYCLFPGHYIRRGSSQLQTDGCYGLQAVSEAMQTIRHGVKLDIFN